MSSPRRCMHATRRPFTATLRTSAGRARYRLKHVTFTTAWNTQPTDLKPCSLTLHMFYSMFEAFTYTSHVHTSFFLDLHTICACETLTKLLLILCPVCDHLFFLLFELLTTTQKTRAMPQRPPMPCNPHSSGRSFLHGRTWKSDILTVFKYVTDIQDLTLLSFIFFYSRRVQISENVFESNQWIFPH